MKKLLTVLSLSLFTSVAYAQPNDSVSVNPKAAKKELAKCLKEARTLATDASNPDFGNARKQIAKAMDNSQYAANEADVLYAAGDVEYYCYNNERNKPALKKSIDYKVLYSASFKAYTYYNDAYDLYSYGSNAKANSKEKSAIQKKAWPLFAATGGFRVNAADAYEKQDWQTSHDCWNLFVTAIDSRLVKDLTADNKRAKDELAVFSKDSIVNHAKYFRALTSVLSGNHATAIDELKDMRYLGYEQDFVFQELARQYKAIGEDGLYENTLIEGAKLIPNDPWFAQNLMNIYLESKDYDAAAVTIDALLTADPDNPSILSLKGTLVELQGDNDQALKYLEKAYAIDSTTVEINSNLGRVWYNKGNAIETSYFDKRQYVIADELSMPYYLKALKFYLKAYDADADHADKTIANGVRNVLYKQFMRADCKNPQELIKLYNEVSRAYGLPQFNK